MQDKVVFNAILLDKVITDLKISILLIADKINGKYTILYD